MRNNQILFITFRLPLSNLIPFSLLQYLFSTIISLSFFQTDFAFLLRSLGKIWIFQLNQIFKQHQSNNLFKFVPNIVYGVLILKVICCLYEILILTRNDWRYGSLE